MSDGAIQSAQGLLSNSNVYDTSSTVAVPSHKWTIAYCTVGVGTRHHVLGRHRTYQAQLADGSDTTAGFVPGVSAAQYGNKSEYVMHM